MTAIIIDGDPGHDDAIAILLALASPEVNLLGITTVSGNQTLAKTTANAIRVLDHLERDDISVAAGADRPLVRSRHTAAEVHGETGLDGPDLPPPARAPLQQHAIEWMAATLAESTKPITLVPVGPLTNIALFLATYPNLTCKIDRIVLMGGAIGEGNVTPAAEFNIWADPEAAHRVFRSGLDITMVGLDVTHQALMTQAHVKQLKGKAGKLVADLYGFFSKYHANHYGWDGSPIHDAVALAHVIDPNILQTAPRGVSVDTGPELSRGRTHVDLRGDRWEANAHVAIGINADRFLALLIERINSLG